MVHNVCDELSAVLQTDYNISESVIKGIVDDPIYARNLFTCRSEYEYLHYLLRHPPAKTEKKYQNKELIAEAKAILNKWIHTVQAQNRKNAYEEKFRGYFNKKSSCASCSSASSPVSGNFREVYLDHNATTYVREEIKEELDSYRKDPHIFFNPSSNSAQGEYTSDIIYNARTSLADALGVTTDEIYFTGSGSEANNLAIKGIALKHLKSKGHIITARTEHLSVLGVMEYLESLGFSITYLDPDRFGAVSPESVRQAIKDTTILVSIMAANNEVGTINPVKEIGSVCTECNVPFHVDAIQAFCKIPLYPEDWGISLLSVSGHKVYAPKGVGALYIRTGISLTPLIHGGGQETGLRAGTENIESILAFGKAVELLYGDMDAENKRLIALKDYFLKELRAIEPGIIINGEEKKRLPNNLSVSFPGADSGDLIYTLSKYGISVSASSACSSRKIKTSHVLIAIGVNTEEFGTIRFGFGLKNTKEDLDYVLECLRVIL